MALTLISTHDIAVLGASSSIDITSGIGSTYPVYEFHFVNMHPQSDAKFTFQANAHDGSSQLTGFNETIQSTFFYSWHKEDDSSAGIGDEGNNDQGNGTSYQPLAGEIVESSDTDSSISGILTLYDPSNTTYVKHFNATTNYFQQDPAQQNAYIAGYINTTNAITQISFKFDSGNIDAGVIKMFGVS